jgi:signal transduction histidine kinase
MLTGRARLTIRPMRLRGNCITWLRLAGLAVAVTAATLVIWQKHLIAHPGPGLILVLGAALPFALDVRFPRLLRSPWPGAIATLVVLGCGAALLAYRPASGDAAILFFIALAAQVSAAAPLGFSIAAGAAAVALPEVMNLAGEAHAALAAAIGTAFAWVAGTGMRAQDRLTRELVAMQAAAADHEITAERQQLAREFHDLVGHTLSVTMLHMTAVRMSLDDREIDEALESLSEAQRTGREAMREMRQSVALLGARTPSGPAVALPQARDLPDLVAEYGSAGLKVKLDMTGDLGTIPGDVGLAAYRIVQESLSNVTKHAPDATVQVAILIAGRELTVTVSNDMHGPSEGSGHGIAGMTQRADLLGGTLSAGPVGPAGRRWRVEAILPLGDR